MRLNAWAASLKSRTFPGGHVTVSMSEPVGTAKFHLALYDAGSHSGRDVELIIPPKDLDVFARIIADAIKTRDRGTEHAARSQTSN